MRSSQTTTMFPLSAVKPLDRIEAYRAYCLAQSRKAIASAPGPHRENCLSCGTVLAPFGAGGAGDMIGGLDYCRCPECGSLFLRQCSARAEWEALLQGIAEHKNSPAAFHHSIAKSRHETVVAPRVEWIQNTLRLHGLSKPSLVELAGSSSSLSAQLKASAGFGEVTSIPEEESAMSGSSTAPRADILLLPESLDRSTDPAGLLHRGSRILHANGFLFATSLVSSGFDVRVLGLDNLYLYPPDRTNCFSLDGLVKMIRDAGFAPLEISTPGVLDVEIVRAHVARNPSTLLSPFERQILSADPDKREAFQRFLQENLMSSFARIVARKIEKPTLSTTLQST